MVKVTVEVSDEFADCIILSSLIGSYHDQLEERDKEKRISKDETSDVLRRDVARTNYKDSKKFVKAIRTTIKYYTTHDERIELGLDF